MMLKKLITSVLSFFAFGACIASVASCDSAVLYQANTRFLYSVNGGTNWSETIQEVEVNMTYYLAIEMQVVQSKETNEEKIVKADITIPNTRVLDCYLDDHPGVSITGVPDPINNSITYQFNIVAGVSPAKFRVLFECTPLAEGKASIYVVYDDNVSPSWDATGTIKYVVSDVSDSSSAESSVDTSDTPNE